MSRYNQYSLVKKISTNECLLDSEQISWNSVIWDLNNDFWKPLVELRKKYPEFKFEYVESKKRPIGVMKKEIKAGYWKVANWRTK